MRILRSLLTTLFLIAVVVPCASAQVAEVADLLVTKTGPDTAAAGSNVSYDVTITNLGPDPSASISLSDPIPPGMTFVSATPPGCTTPAVGSGGTITCTIPTLAVSASVMFTFVFNIPPATPPGTTFLNVATATSSTDASEENNQGIQATSTPPAPTADMGVSKNAPGSSGPDTDIAFTIAVTNSGPDAATNVVVTDTLPGNLTFVSIADGGLSCTTPAVGSGGTITCTAASFPASTMATIMITAHIPAGTTSGTSYLNQVTVASANDPNVENNESTTTTTVSRVDISVTKNGPPSVNAGDDITYAIQVSNAGPDTAIITLTDAIPAGTTFSSFTQNTGPSASCSEPPVGSFGGQVLCGLTLAALQSADFTLVVRAGDTTQITNVATVSTESFDNNLSNNSANVPTTVTPMADVSVNKTGPATITAGTNATYTITVTNSGASTAASVSLTDTLPAGMTLVSLSQTGGSPAFNCTGATCTVATMPPNNTATFTLVASLPSSAASGLTLTNTANVSSTTTDPDPADNQSTTTATSNTSANLSATKSGPPGVTAGSNVTYTVTITNGGPSDAANATLTDPLPPGTTFVSHTQQAPFTCVTPAVGSPGTIVCSAASFAAGASATFTFVFNVSASATGSIANTATAASTTTDPTPGNNAGSTTANISTATDVSISKTAVHSPVNATFTIVVRNIGPVDATGTTVTDTLPAGTTFTSASSTQGSCSGTSTVTCNVGTLTPSSSATITIVVSLQGTPFGTISNTASVTITNPDSNPANNASSASFVLGGSAPLSPLALALLALLLASTALYVMR